LTSVNIGVGKKPGILISGHDLKDMEELLETDGEYGNRRLYPRGNAAGELLSGLQKIRSFHRKLWELLVASEREFESFNGPILLTTNCLIPLKRTTPT
jgi:hydroxylamine reductase